MAQTVCILLGDEDRLRLAAILGDRNRPQKHVQRARIVLLSADRLPVLAVARQTDASRPAVWRWQQRFADEGVEGLLRDKTRQPGKKPLPAATVAKSWRFPAAMDAGYGSDTRMRTEIAALGLRYIAGIRPHATAWPPGLGPLPVKPWSGRGRPTSRTRRDPEHQPIQAKALALLDVKLGT